MKVVYVHTASDIEVTVIVRREDIVMAPHPVNKWRGKTAVNQFDFAAVVNGVQKHSSKHAAAVEAIWVAYPSGNMEELKYQEIVFKSDFMHFVKLASAVAPLEVIKRGTNVRRCREFVVFTVDDFGQFLLQSVEQFGAFSGVQVRWKIASFDIGDSPSDDA